jgi:hypothetical protein
MEKNRQSVFFNARKVCAVISFNKLLYFVLLLIAVTIYFMQRLQLPLPALINNYVNDLLCLPLVLGAITYVIRSLKKDASFELPIGFIVVLAGFYSFYFECYLPQFNSRYTADFIDVILYFTAGFAFFFRDKIRFSLAARFLKIYYQ